jgi:hypothetical protein
MGKARQPKLQRRVAQMMEARPGPLNNAEVLVTQDTIWCRHPHLHKWHTMERNHPQQRCHTDIKASAPLPSSPTPVPLLITPDATPPAT